MGTSPQATVIVWLIYFAIALWVASVQVKVREIKPGWGYFWCIMLGPLWGWIVIALACKRKAIPN